MGQSWHPFVNFRPFLNSMTNLVQNLTKNGRNVATKLGIRTRDYRMESADEAT